MQGLFRVLDVFKHGSILGVDTLAEWLRRQTRIEQFGYLFSSEAQVQILQVSVFLPFSIRR